YEHPSERSPGSDEAEPPPASRWPLPAPDRPAAVRRAPATRSTARAVLLERGRTRSARAVGHGARTAPATPPQLASGSDWACLSRPPVLDEPQTLLASPLPRLRRRPSLRRAKRSSARAR